MAKLIYSAIMSLDGYVADADGNFDWAAPDEEVHAFVNDLERPVGTYLYGRRMYEVMVSWETASHLDGPAARHAGLRRDLAGRRQDRVLRTLDTVASARTRIERDFDPEAVRQMKATAARDITRGRPRPRRAGDQSRPGRRVPPVRHARSWWAAAPAPSRRRPCGARAAGRAPFRQRRGSPPLPHGDVRTGEAGASTTRRREVSPLAWAGRCGLLRPCR